MLKNDFKNAFDSDTQHDSHVFKYKVKQHELNNHINEWKK